MRVLIRAQQFLPSGASIQGVEASLNHRVRQYKGLRRISPVPQAFFSALLLGITLGLCLLAAEAFLRVKNGAMMNYDIEMWRYANELKQKSDDPQIDFDHRHSQSALLQSTEIRLNCWGLRGPELAPLQSGQHRAVAERARTDRRRYRRQALGPLAAARTARAGRARHHLERSQWRHACRPIMEEYGAAIRPEKPQRSTT